MSANQRQRRQHIDYTRVKMNISTILLIIVSLVVLAVSIYYASTVWLGPKKLSLKEERKIALDLVNNNFDSVYYFHLTTLPLEPDFDAKSFPDGTAPCKPQPFANYNELEQFLSSTYLPKEVHKILTTEAAPGLPRYQDVDGRLCAAIVSPITNYDRDLSNISLSLSPVTEEEININLLIPSKSSGDNDSLSLVMINMDGTSSGWRLKEMIS